ncbi:MAG TPA: hypothetical protein VIX35_06070 [Vicinamibacterales bacterium]
MSAPLDPAVVLRAYEQSGAERWSLDPSDFERALTASVVHASIGQPGPPGELDAADLVGSLHLGDLALAAACAAGIERAWDYFALGVGGASAGMGGATARGARPNAVREAANPASSVTRWRILASRDLERSTDDGRTWEPVAVDPPSLVTSGAAPSRLVCWLVGRAGVVLVTTDASHFTRLTFPAALDVLTVHAADALNATVTTTGGRSFETTDGGKTWSEKRIPTV